MFWFVRYNIIPDTFRVWSVLALDQCFSVRRLRDRGSSKSVYVSVCVL